MTGCLNVVSGSKCSMLESGYSDLGAQVTQGNINRFGDERG